MLMYPDAYILLSDCNYVGILIAMILNSVKIIYFMEIIIFSIFKLPFIILIVYYIYKISSKIYLSTYFIIFRNICKY